MWMMRVLVKMLLVAEDSPVVMDWNVVAGTEEGVVSSGSIVC